MKTVFRRTIIGASIGAACAMAAPAQAVTGVLFDVNGAAGANAMGTDRFLVDTFDWGPGNTLATDTTAPADVESMFILSQANLTGLRFGGSAIFSYTGAFGAQELTFQMQAAATPALEGDDSIVWTENPDGSLTRFFRMFHDFTKNSNAITGCGYGSTASGTGGVIVGGDCTAQDLPGEILILSGSVTIEAMNWDPKNTGEPPFPLLDAKNSDDQNGVRTRTATGSGLFNIDVTFAHSDYFLTPIGGLTVDMKHGGTNADPFDQENPSDQVVGRNIGDTAANRDAAYGTDLVNDLNCPAGSGPDSVCDLHMQSDTATNVLAELVPEPGSLALIGLGLGALGFVGRRRKIGA